MMDWLRAQRPRHWLMISVVILTATLVWTARKALLPFVLGTTFAYILLPLTSFLNSFLPSKYRQSGVWRGLSVLAVYVLVISLIVSVLAFVIPPIFDQIGFMVQQLPDLIKKVYNAVPAFVQDWLSKYQAVPQDIQTALQRGMSSMIQTLITTLQGGVFKTVNIVFTTLSFVLGLLVIPLWMFYLLRDQPALQSGFHQLVPARYREDADTLVGLVDKIMSAYLRGRLILGLSMAVMSTAILLLLGTNFALLLGTVMGLCEVVPLIGPILGALPIVVVTLATSPSQLVWVILLIMAAQQIINYVFVPQVARGTVGLHPALVMLVIVIGSEVAGVWGVILSVPIAAVIRDVTRYLLLRLSDKPLSPQEAIVRLSQRP